MKFSTTLNRIRKHRPCADGWEMLLDGLGKTAPDDEPLSLVRILEINGIEDAIWALRCIDDLPEIRLFACRCAREVLPLYEQRYPGDMRPRVAIETAERYAVGQATGEEMAAAGDVAWDAAWDVAWDAAWAAWAAAWAAAEAAWDAAEAAWDAARGAARGAALERQAEIFREMFSEVTA